MKAKRIKIEDLKDKYFETDPLFQWKVNTPAFLKEIAQNSQVATIGVCFQIFANILEEVSDRAIQLNDPKMNALMCRLALYEQSDPYSKDFDAELTKQTIIKGYKK